MKAEIHLEHNVAAPCLGLLSLDRIFKRRVGKKRSLFPLANITGYFLPLWFGKIPQNDYCSAWKR
jgi:hypothetical protein